MFFCLFNRIVVHFHLFGEELFQPCVFLDVVMDEAYRLFTLYLHGGFTFLPVVEPCLEFSQRIYDAAVAYGFVMEFFFMSPLMVERYTL